MNRLLTARHAASRADLMTAGLSGTAIKTRVAAGRLECPYRGVYFAGGSPPTKERRWAAAVAACGPGAVLSHLSAAALWELRSVDPVVIDVSLPSRGRRSRAGVRVHRPRHLTGAETADHRGIPLTSASRTIFDCAALLGRRPLERMLDEAHHRRLLDEEELKRALARQPHRHGAGNLRRILATHDAGSTRTRSELEEGFLALLRLAELPLPLVNEPLGPYTIDFLWPAQRVAVETDGGHSHARLATRERDHTRDAWLHAHGYLPLRFSWNQINFREHEVLPALRRALIRE